MIKDVEAGSKEEAMNGTNVTQNALLLPMDRAMSEELEDGELEEEAKNGEVVTNGESTQKSHVCSKPATPARSRLIDNQEFSSSMPEQMQPPPKPSDATGEQAMPGAIIGNGKHTHPFSEEVKAYKTVVQDEALKNLMMSWYYAGYYTGLYEGQQQAQNGTPK